MMYKLVIQTTTLLQLCAACTLQCPRYFTSLLLYDRRAYAYAPSVAFMTAMVLEVAMRMRTRCMHKLHSQTQAVRLQLLLGAYCTSCGALHFMLTGTTGVQAALL